MKNIQIVKILRFNWRIIKNIKTKKFTRWYENNENLRISFSNHENHENDRIPNENQENYENHNIHVDNHKKYKTA